MGHGAELITEPVRKDGKTRGDIRDPDGNVIGVGQGTELTCG
jgi:hypothetical protein